jgi:hypothetical protein
MTQRNGELRISELCRNDILMCMADPMSRRRRPAAYNLFVLHMHGVL